MFLSFLVQALAPADRFPQQVLDLPVHTAKLVGSPGLEITPKLRVYAKQELLALRHLVRREYRC
jgi:hypothetical protein